MSAFSDRHRAAAWLADILDNIARIEAYSAGFDQNSLAQDGLRRDAVERCLERICEAAHRLGDQAQKLMPGQPWQDIRGMGNRLRHAYDRVDFAVIWNVVEGRLPALKVGVIRAREDLSAAGAS